MTEPRRILVADDEPVIHEILEKYLGRFGYAVERAEDGIEALARLEEVRCDLVIADVRMPRMDGLQLLAETRQRWPLTPVIIISGHGDEQMESEATRLGAVAFESKPLHMRELVEQIGSLLGGDGG